MPSNEERRQAAREKLAQQNLRREAQVRKRKVLGATLGIAVVVALVAAGLYVWLPQGPRAPLRVGAEDRFRSLHTNCDFPDRPDQSAATRQAVQKMKDNIAQARTQLGTLTGEQRTALEGQITEAEAQNTETEKQLPLIDGIAERNKSVTKPSGTDVPNSGTLTGTITTNQGAIGYELDRSKAPCNVKTFETLIAAKYFDNTICHRETASESQDKKNGLFVIQCGDPSGTGIAGPPWTSPDETPGVPAGRVSAGSAGAPPRRWCTRPARSRSRTRTTRKAGRRTRDRASSSWSTRLQPAGELLGDRQDDRRRPEDDPGDRDEGHQSQAGIPGYATRATRHRRRAGPAGQHRNDDAELTRC